MYTIIGIVFGYLLYLVIGLITGFAMANLPSPILWIVGFCFLAMGGFLGYQRDIQSSKVVDSLAKNDLKSCPYCGEKILVVAIKCKHCQSELK